MQSIADQVKKNIEDGTGMAMERDDNVPVSDKNIKEKKKTKTNLLCRFCGRAGHCHRSSKQCGKHEEYLGDKSAVQGRPSLVTNTIAGEKMETKKKNN